MWKVLIADDEPKIRHGLRSLVERCGRDLEVVAEAEDGRWPTNWPSSATPTSS